MQVAYMIDRGCQRSYGEFHGGIRPHVSEMKQN